MLFGYSFGSSFIDEKVFVYFYGGADIFETFSDYLETRTVEELRRLERRFEKNFTGEWQIRFDDYSLLVNRNNRVYVYIQYPNDEEKREDYMPREVFFEVLVKLNIQYDRLLIRRGKHHIGPRARAIIENMSWVPYEWKELPKIGKVRILFPEGCFAAFKACLNKRSEEELKTIAAAAKRACDTSEEDYREDLRWNDGSGLCLSHETTEAWMRAERDGKELLSTMGTAHFSKLAEDMVGKYRRMREKQEKEQEQEKHPTSEEMMNDRIEEVLALLGGPKTD